ncbi:MAG: hypothetical protein ISS90_00645 [Candidatus Omnitrophica bacterium]|nr:hypothetical protein [Candidatus Omnitrophota bacterium]
MARRIATMVIALLVIAAFALPAVAAQKSMQKSAQTSQQTEEKPLWTIIADSFKDFKMRDQDKLRGGDKITVFQDASDGIKSGTKSAKEESLRDK